MSSFQKLLPRRERHSRYSKHLKEEVRIQLVVFTWDLTDLSEQTSNILTRPLFRGFFSSQLASENCDNQNQKKVRDRLCSCHGSQ